MDADRQRRRTAQEEADERAPHEPTEGSPGTSPGPQPPDETSLDDAPLEPSGGSADGGENG